jgi:hypothetical protein
MKKIIYTLLFLGTLNFCNSQVNDVSSLKYGTKKQLTNSKRERVVTSKFIIKDDKLKTFFVGEVIPNTFPEYNHLISYQENKILVKSWLKSNKNLIKPELLERYKNRKTEPIKLN